METNLQTRQTNLIEFDASQVDLIKRTIAKDATDDELKMFMYQCRTTGLNPLARQIYFMKRAGKVTMQVSIDGFRVIAERSGVYAGQDEPEFIEKDGKLEGVKVRIYRFSPSGARYQAAVGVAYMNEYMPQQGQDFMWKKMPRTMIAKVAEALGLRKAFPQDLSGLYTIEEMQQSDTPIAEMAADWQIIAIEDKMELARLTDKQQQYIKEKVKAGLTFEEAAKTLDWMNQFIDPLYRSQKDINEEILQKVDNEE